MIRLDSMLSGSSNDIITHELDSVSVDLINERGIMTIDGAMIEFKDVFKEREPYIAVQTLAGLCYKWDETYINLLQVAMSTDSMENMTEDEKRAWYYFVNFQNYHSHSALVSDCNGTAIGCTIPDENNISYVVCANGDACTTRCQPPGYEVEGEDIWHSLDKVFMDLYNCIEIDDCERGENIEDIAPCPLT